MFLSHGAVVFLPVFFLTLWLNEIKAEDLRHSVSQRFHLIDQVLA